MVKKLEKLGGATQAENDLDKYVLEVKALVTKIGDLSKSTFKQNLYIYIYDESHLIFHTFFTELNKKLQIYSLISTSAIGIKTTHLVRPSNSLKFQVMNNKNLTLNLEDIKEPGKIKTKDAKVTNFSILSTKRKTGLKIKRSYEIRDEFRIFVIQNFELFEKLNPKNIQIRDSEINSKLTKYSNKRYKYRFIITNLLLSSSIEQDTNVIFSVCNGLNNAKESLINGKLYKTLGVFNRAKIKDWNKLKGQSKWVNIVFKDSENPTVAKYFACVFETINFRFIKFSIDISRQQS